MLLRFSFVTIGQGDCERGVGKRRTNHMFLPKNCCCQPEQFLKRVHIDIEVSKIDSLNIICACIKHPGKSL